MELYTTLCDDHRRLDVLLEVLLDRFHMNDAEAARAAWTELDRGLTAHIKAEETSILPLFAQHDRDEAAVIRSEHARIQSLLTELGVMLDLHALREEKVAEFIDFLRAHAAREESVLYPWAEQDLPEAPRKSALQRLLGAVRRGLGVETSAADLG
jgi:hemerythrin superfamily protein